MGLLFLVWFEHRQLSFVQAEQLLENEEMIPSESRKELIAFVSDAFCHYYFKRGKLSASLQYVQKAAKIHKVRDQWGHYAKCLLHWASILSKRGDHLEARKCLAQILKLVEEHKLEDGGASAQKICMVAVCYHNLAIELLHLREIQDACVSSQNARRLARLSLSYSNRWLKTFDSTHKCVLAAVEAVQDDDKILAQ